ncbi:hypothetical protein RRG08_004774 [Elysia crispata]|uniref:Uncharacterized protein n=1 Tax=Elysia crispata TaxID=231223 RepID=A0AAE1AID8_9GAST|nr:hypothetical protein RRG08_004774 [Elysia crispata]
MKKRTSLVTCFLILYFKSRAPINVPLPLSFRSDREEPNVLRTTNVRLFDHHYVKPLNSSHPPALWEEKEDERTGDISGQGGGPGSQGGTIVPEVFKRKCAHDML